MDQRLAKRNFDFCEETGLLKRKTELQLLELASRLHRIFNEKMYEPNYETFGEYSESIGLSPGSASKLVAVHQKFILDYSFKPERIALAGGAYKVSELIKYIKNKKDADQWLVKSKELNRFHLRQEIMERKTGIPMDECKHRYETFTLKKCTRCGYTYRDDSKE